MKYFTTLHECKGTCYHEFYKGKWDGHTFWKEDSLYLHDDVLYNLKLEDIFYQVNSSYDPYNETEINIDQWMQICTIAETIGGEVEEAINEAKSWLQETLEEDNLFTILGI